MSEKTFIIYKSSAGSGKTYTLAMEYLKLALAHPFAFRQILAVTFTNKATKEMKERILEELERLTHTIHPERMLDGTLLGHWQLTEDQLKKRAGEVLSAILHHYSDFSISTIDSFFQRVVRAFAREIDLQAKFDIEMDQAAVMERLVDRIMFKVAEDPNLHRWLVDFADEKIREGKSWDIRWNISNLGSQIFQEDFKKHQHEIRAFLKHPENILAFRSRLFEERGMIQKIVIGIKKKAEAIIGQEGLKWTDFKGGSRSPLLFFDKLDSGKTLFPKISPSIQNCVDNVEAWFTKKGPFLQIENAFQAGLNELLIEALAIIPRWNTLEAVRRNFYVFGIFSQLLEELRQLKEEENIMLISDANEFLKEITAESEAPFIYEKVGNQYKNFLIDEFQDTSGFQWASFFPLLENSMATGELSLIVGDVKQSIYRWRGGDLTLLLNGVEQQIGSGRVEVKDLDTNYRSLPVLVNFNNALFEQLSLSLMVSAQQKYGVQESLLSAIGSAYQQVRQKVAMQKLASPNVGKVMIEFISKEGDDKVKDLALAKIPQMVRTLQDRGYQLSDMAVLVRRKVEGQMVAETLMQYAADHPQDGYRYEVLSGEAMFLHKAATVKCLVSTLTYLVHPDDELAARAMWYHRERLRGGIIDHGLFDKEDLHAGIMAEIVQFENKKIFLEELPLVELVEELVETLGLNLLGKERAYISGFKEAVFDYVSKNKSDVGGFLDWWEVKKDLRTVKIPEAHDAVRVLTIHKSKGLQFKAVLMPFMDWDIVDSKGVIWSPYEEKDSAQLIVPLNLSSALAETSFSDIYRQEVMMAFLDSLNMIYVALTRAEEVFWGLGEAHLSTGDGVLNKLSHNIKVAVNTAVGANDQLPLAQFYDHEKEILEIGEWPEPTRSVLPPAFFPELSWRYRNWSHLLQVKKYSDGLTEEKAALMAKRNFGVLIHRILERLRHVEDLDNLIQEAFFEGQLNNQEVGEVKSLFGRLFDKPQMLQWFSREANVFAEQGILLPGGSGKRPDRIIVENGHSIVIDFKTGEEKPSHHSQVREYMSLVKDLTHNSTEGYLVYIETAEIKIVQ